MKNLKYIPKIWTAVLFFVLLVLAFLLFQARKYEMFRFGFINDIFVDFHKHISNFSISYMLYSGIGYLWLLLGMKLRHIATVGLLIVGANIVYDFWIPILNTIDRTDAYYGIAGTFTAFLFLFGTKKFGLKHNLPT